MNRARVIAVSAISAAIVAGAGYAVADTTHDSCAAGTRSSVGYTTKCSVTVTVPAAMLPTKTVTATKTVTVTASPSRTSPPTSASSTSRPSSSSASPTRSSSSSSPPASGFPNASNTGVPAGTALTDYTGPTTITADNTVIDSKTVRAGLVIHAKNVTITKSTIGGNIWLDQDVMPSAGAWSVTVQDSEIDAGTSGEQGGICCGNYTLLRVNAHGGHNGAQCENGASYCRISDSWLHGQLDGGPVGKNHLGGFLNDGETPTSLVHNTIVCDHPVENGEGCTGDVNLIPNFGPIENVTVEGNFLGANNTGSAYCTYAGATPGNEGYASQVNHVVYKDNVFQRGHGGSYPNQCDDYGPVTGWKTGAPGNVWSGNTWEDGAPLECDNNPACG
jgi:hypothetical protein